MVTDEILLTIPDQAETYENPMLEVSSGSPVPEYVEVTQGSAAIYGNPKYMTGSECPTIHPHPSTDGRPSGCYKVSGGIYFNTLTTSSTECSPTAPCIQKNPLYVSQSECQAYADPSTWYASSYGSTVPSGCFLHSNGQVQFNQDNGANQCNNAGHKCIQKSYPESSVSCRAYSLQHNYLFWDLVANYAYTEVSSGSPVLEGDATYVTEAECKAYNDANGRSWASFSYTERPSGCIVDNGSWTYWNTHSNTNNCATNYKCIQKDTSQVTMLCHVGNTLQ